jgi:hypothetical protein
MPGPREGIVRNGLIKSLRLDTGFRRYDVSGSSYAVYKCNSLLTFQPKDGMGMVHTDPWGGVS